MHVADKGRDAASTRLARRLLGLVAIALLVCSLVSACGGTSTSTSTAAGSSSSSRTLPLPTTTTTPTLVKNPESQRYMTMLKETYDAANAISRDLENRGASATDPEAAKVYALRARAQAITARKAMVDKDPALADAATLQMRKLLTQAQALAQSPTLEIVQTALSTSDGLPEPSASPEQAAALLDKVIEDLAPLMSSGSGS